MSPPAWSRSCVRRWSGSMSELKVTTLDDLVKTGHLEVGDGYRTNRSERGTPGLPILRVAEVLDGRIEPHNTDPVSERYRSAMGSKISQPGDVILTTKGTVGRVAIMPNESPEFVYSPQVCYFRLGNDSLLSSRYLYYWFKSEGFWSQARSLKGQTDMADYINLADIKSLKITLPSRSMQNTVVEILGALDDKIAVNDRVAETCLELALTKYEAAVLGGCFDRAVSMAESARWFSGGTPNTAEDAYWGGDIPWISALSLKSPWIDDSDRKVTIAGAENGTRLVPKDTVIFVVRGSSLDTEFRIGLTQREVAFGQDCKALRAADGVDPCMLFVSIKSRTSEILQLVDHTGHGAGRLSTDLLTKVQLNLPSRHESSKTGAELSALVAVGAVRRVENRNLQALRDTLLPRLMSGRIQVRDAEKVVEDVT
jgi:type I restriction enzyme S subunit